ncbi:LysM peptidoglycan-binding domain-containing protein [Candidatus Pacearchaeota archaeon]|nr:LysM peptidoglycan-binding domain-containing protein [Candidatus Pacearchaeota archaeon]
MSLRKVLGISVGVIAAGLIGLYAVSEVKSYQESVRRNERLEVLKSHESLKTIEIDKGDTYWKLAQSVGNHPCLRDISVGDIMNYLQKVNKGKNLIAGQTLQFPHYNPQKCKRLENK